MNLFFYGTLLDRDVRRAVLGSDFGKHQLAPGALPDHVLRRARGEAYPILLPRRGGFVRGVIVADVSGPEMRRLDRFEGSGYRRSIRNIVLADGSIATATLYLPCRALRAEPRPWAFATWQEREKRAFLKKHFAIGQNGPVRAAGR